VRATVPERTEPRVRRRPLPVCGGSLTLEERGELLRLSNESNARALADGRSRGYEHIVDDPKYEGFFVGID
jgi:hypothetical protein